MLIGKADSILMLFSISPNFWVDLRIKLLKEMRLE